MFLLFPLFLASFRPFVCPNHTHVEIIREGFDQRGHPYRVCRTDNDRWTCPVNWFQLLEYPYCEAPVMHTFWEPKESTRTSDADKNMLDTWETSWNAAGFETNIISLDDAKLHPRYDEMAKTLEWLGARGALGPDINYDTLCFLRYFAMAAVGGGWMSDYDTLPLSTTEFPPSYGRFTVYEWTVPSLAKGDASEWTRIGVTLVEAAAKHYTMYVYDREDKPNLLFSDMMALQSLAGKSVFDSESRVAGADEKYGLPLLRPDVCEVTRGKLAVHFSHYVLGIIKLPIENRSSFAVSMLKSWTTACSTGNNQSLVY